MTVAHESRSHVSGERTGSPVVVVPACGIQVGSLSVAYRRGAASGSATARPATALVIGRVRPEPRISMVRLQRHPPNELR